MIALYSPALKSFRISRRALSTRMAALSVSCFTPRSPSSPRLFPRTTDARITYSRHLRAPQRSLHAKFPPCSLIQAQFIFINFIYVTTDARLSLFARDSRFSSFPSLCSGLRGTFPSLSAYCPFRRGIQQDAGNRIARLVARLQFLNYAAIICLFPRDSDGPSSRRNYRVSVLTFSLADAPSIHMNFMR